MGDKLIFREGRTKGLGVIKQLGYDKLKNPLSRKAKEDAAAAAAAEGGGGAGAGAGAVAGTAAAATTTAGSTK